MYTIQSSNKRIAAVFFLLIVQSGVFASKSRTNCMYGIKAGEKEGWGEPLVEPSTMNCIGDTRSCLRIEVDEIGDPNGERSKLNFLIYPFKVFYEFPISVLECFNAKLHVQPFASL